MLGDLNENCPQKISIFKAQSRIQLNNRYFKNVSCGQCLLEKILPTDQCKLKQHNPFIHFPSLIRGQVEGAVA